jgi:hypothetical protein
MRTSDRVVDTTRRGRGGEVATVGGAFFTYGAIFFDRLAPLYLVALIAQDLGLPAAPGAWRLVSDEGPYLHGHTREHAT